MPPPIYMGVSLGFRYSAIGSLEGAECLRATELTAGATRGIAPPSLSQRENAFCSARAATLPRLRIRGVRVAPARRALLGMLPDPGAAALLPVEHERKPCRE